MSIKNAKIAPLDKRKDKGRVLQMIMGSGKSSVFLPLLALKLADGDHIPFVVVPEALYEETKRKLFSSSHSSFQQQMHVLKVDRSMDTSDQALEELSEKLWKARKNKEYFLVTDTTLHCLLLNFFEIMKNWERSGSPAYGELAGRYFKYSSPKILNSY